MKNIHRLEHGSMEMKYFQMVKKMKDLLIGFRQPRFQNLENYGAEQIKKLILRKVNIIL